MVLANGNNPVTYSNQVNTFSYVTNGLTLGAGVITTLADPGDQLVLHFLRNCRTTTIFRLARNQLHGNQPDNSLARRRHRAKWK